MEANNMMTMREAVENSNGLLEELAAIGEWGESAREQIAENNAALAIPLRNCDVGTVEEQKRRFKEYCDRHFDWIKYGCKNCPARSYIEGWDTPYCQLKWAQMPYEEGGVTDGVQSAS